MTGLELRAGEHVAAAAQVVIRNPGGAWSDTQKKYIYEPFTNETGIEVVIVPTTLTKMLAMVKSGNNELDDADGVGRYPSSVSAVEVGGERVMAVADPLDRPPDPSRRPGNQREFRTGAVADAEIATDIVDTSDVHGLKVCETLRWRGESRANPSLK